MHAIQTEEIRHSMSGVYRCFPGENPIVDAFGSYVADTLPPDVKTMTPSEFNKHLDSVFSELQAGVSTRYADKNYYRMLVKLQGEPLALTVLRSRMDKILRAAFPFSKDFAEEVLRLRSKKPE
ncbi:MAG: hypothetical protein V1881_00620 [Candidatus Micrarchaeota archaeon]